MGEGWWSWVGAMAWQVALLALVVWLIDLVLRRRGWPQVRYALWALVLVKLFIPPSFALPSSVVSRVLPGGEQAVAVAAPVSVELPDPAEPAAFQSMDRAVSAVPPAEPLVASLVPAETPAPAVGASLPLKAWAMLGSGAVTLLLLIWLIVRALRLRRLILADSTKITPDWINGVVACCARRLGLRRFPRVVVTEGVKSAAVFGILRPVLLLPEAAREVESPLRMEHIMLHELAHVKRGDLAMNTAQALVQVAFWFHPAVWLAGTHLRHLRELCCDASVSRLLRERTSEYRETLVDAARRMVFGRERAGLGLLGLFENASRLRQRLEHLERPSWKHRWLEVIASLAAAALMVACIVPMAGVAAEAQGTEIVGTVVSGSGPSPHAAAMGQEPGSPSGEGMAWISVSPHGTYVAAYVCRPTAFPARLSILDSSARKLCEVQVQRLGQGAGHEVRPVAWAPDESVLFIASGGDTDTEGNLLTLSLPEGAVEKAMDLPSALNFSGLHALSSEAVLCTLAGHIERHTPPGLYLLEKRNGKWRTDPLWTEEYTDVRCLWSTPDGDGYRLLLANLTHGGATNLIALLTARLHGSQLSERELAVVQMMSPLRIVDGSPHGDSVGVLLSAASKLLLYAAEGRWETTAVSLPRPGSRMAFSPDGKKLALWYDWHGERVRPEQLTQKVLIVDTKTMRITESPIVRAASVAWLSPDELLLATYWQMVKYDIGSDELSGFLLALPPPEATVARAPEHSPADPAPDRNGDLKPLRGGFGPPRLITRRIRALASVYAADLDGDGDSDLLSVSETDEKVAWYENTGGGNFSEQRPITGGLLPKSVPNPACARAADLDGNGDADLVVGSHGFWESNEGGVWWFENLGGGRFAPKVPVVTGLGWVRDVHAADLDGDGDNDVLFTSVEEDRVAWCENLGGGQFAAPTTLTTDAHRAASVSTVDLDGDGDQDVLSGSFSGVSWHENMGAGRFGPQGVLTQQLKWMMAVKGADLDGDGAPDVVASYMSPKRATLGVAWYRNMGGGRFGPERVITEHALSFDVADLDRDGDPDVISSTDEGLGWFENAGGSLEPIQVIAPRLALRAVCATDIDGDGDADVVAGGVGEDERIVWYENLVGMEPSE